MLKIIRAIHRVMGLIGSIIIFTMAITGLLLNNRTLIGHKTETAIKLQKFIFAIHTGLVGSASFIWLTDLGAICMITLSITGISMWIIIRIKKTRNSRGD